MFRLLSITAVVFVCLALKLTTDAVLNPPIEFRKGAKGPGGCFMPKPVKLTDFRYDALQLINKYRELHSVRALTLSNSLNDIAQEIADKMAKNNSLAEESRGGKLGENFFMVEGTSLTDSQVVELALTVWYSESKNYDYNNLEYCPPSRHFTQMVWPDSELFGVGFSSSCDYSFVVNTFYPPGNKEPTFPQGINPPQPW